MNSALTSIFVIICGYALWKLLSFLRNYFRLREVLNKIPGPRDIPFIGNAHILEKDSASSYNQFHAFSKEYKDSPIFRIWLGVKPVIYCHTPESVEQILFSSVHINKNSFYKFIIPWLGNGILTSSGTQWKDQRKYLTPAFHFQILYDFIPIFNEQSKILVDILSTHENTGIVFDIVQPIKNATLDIICETAMGTAIYAQSNGNADYTTALLNLQKDFMHRFTRPWLYPDFLYRLSQRGRLNQQSLRIVHAFRTKIIQERKLKIAKNASEKKVECEDDVVFKKKRRLALLDFLLEHQSATNEITDENIGEQIDTFMFAGHDSLATSISWTLYLLGRHPDIQEKVQIELDGLFVGEPHRDINISDTRKMPYLDKVVKESRRLYPPVPRVGRKIESEITLCGYQIPKDTELTLLVMGLHRNGNIFPEPDEFLPERFDTDLLEKVDKQPFGYVPFSAGPRNCIGSKFAGIEEKIVLASLLRRFIIESVQDVDEVAPSLLLVLHPSKGILVKLFPRTIQ